MGINYGKIAELCFHPYKFRKSQLASQQMLADVLINVLADSICGKYFWGIFVWIFPV